MQQGRAWVSAAAPAWRHHVIQLQLASMPLSAKMNGTTLLAAFGPLGVIENVEIIPMAVRTAGQHERLLPETGLSSQPYLASPPNHSSACQGRWHEHGRYRRIKQASAAWAGHYADMPSSLYIPSVSWTIITLPGFLAALQFLEALYAMTLAYGAVRPGVPSPPARYWTFFELCQGYLSRTSTSCVPTEAPSLSHVLLVP